MDSLATTSSSVRLVRLGDALSKLFVLSSRPVRARDPRGGCRPLEEVDDDKADVA